MRFLILAAALLLPAYSYADDLEKLMYSTCHVRTSKGSGTGTVIGEDKKFVYVLTAQHVIDNHESGIVWFDNERQSHSIPFIVKKKDSNTDLALLLIETKDFGKYPIPQPIPLGYQKINQFDKIYTAGNPNGGWTTLFIGQVAYITDKGTAITPNVIRGRSGSAICNDGKVVGVVNAYSDDGNYALCATQKQILEFLK